ncbi:hypothetical protein KKP91_00435 [Methanothermococcus sp. SCGC AD-155-M21]|nr:hypothetical protein [Methanothermococcus sp. SCGC AD-155-M21]
MLKMSSNNNKLKEELKNKLKELFQFEREDLDFGIYRIMNYKRKEIERFIDKELIEEIKKQLNILSEEEKSIIENKEQLEEIKLSEDLEKEIYNHLITFFSRYYDNGDFISKRRYGKNEKYVIPYNGEEVYLYWVNKNQYYIKTTEYFRKYTFRVKGLTVNFKVLEAEEEKGNIKSQEKKFFILNERIFDFDKDKKELNIYFEYRVISKEEAKEKGWGDKKGLNIKQNKINEKIIKILEKKIPQNNLTGIIFEKEGEKSLLEKHLYNYTRRNTRDYFIHKNLKGFLERELDFYIKNEFLQLEDLQILEQNKYFDKLKVYLIGVKAFRNISLKIIEFLDQIENFQKKLWEKKKFVINTHYVITMDKIKEYAGEEFLEDILDKVLNNKKQLEEWKDLFNIEVKDKDDLIENNTLQGKEYKKLPIDTKYFNEEFKWNLLVALSERNDLEDILDGILIKSENFQGLNLLLNKYYEKVQTVYIDPPFNKDNEADYLYKVGYKDATWITMLENRIRLGRELLDEKGSIFVRCDYNGNHYVRFLLNEIFGKDNFRNEIGIRRFKKNVMEREVKKLPEGLDTIYVYAKNSEYFFYLNPFKMKNEKRGGFWRHMGDSSGQGGPKIFFGKELYPPVGKHWKYSQEKIDQMIEEGKIILQCKHCRYIHDKNKGPWKGCPICGMDDKVQPKYWVEEKDKEVLDSNWSDIYGYSTTWKFQTENSEILLKRVIQSTSKEGDLILDFFLGSGTTIAVAHKLKRKWMGVEMGEHFYTVILPRMKKVLFYDKSGISKEKEVKEKYNPKMAGGFFKYQTLEQYEDALENIEFEKTRKDLLELSDYFVKYMLEWETKGSKTFLKIDDLKDPFNYKLKVLENYQQKIVNVDLVETFNYLLGLNIKGYKLLECNNRTYLFIFGEEVGKKIAIIWRSMGGIGFENDKKIIENIVKDFNPDEVYINRDATVKGFKSIEPLFKSLMFRREG